MSQAVALGAKREVDKPSNTYRLKMPPDCPMTQDQFFELCQLNEMVRLERTAQGELIIMAPSGGESSSQNLSVSATLFFWCKRHGKGKAFDSSAGFVLPNGAIRSPDASWVSAEQLAGISVEQLEKFVPVSPDFVAEILSPSDSLKQTQEKMSEYRDNGTKLGWLINPRNRQVHVYRPGKEVEILDNPATLSGDPELPGFLLDLASVWQP